VFKGRGKAGQRASGKGYQDEAKAKVNMAHKHKGYMDEDGGTRMADTRMGQVEPFIQGVWGAPGWGQAPSLHLVFDAGP